MTPIPLKQVIDRMGATVPKADAYVPAAEKAAA